MKKLEIIEFLKQMSPMRIDNDGPTVVFVKCGRRTKTFYLSGDKHFIIVTTGKYLFKRKYRISRDEL